MSAQGDSIFTHVRSKLRQSRSSMMLTTSTHAQFGTTDWNHVPAAYRPVERTEARVVDGYYLNRPLPGPPPRPRSTTPFLAHDPRSSLHIENLRNPTPRTHRTRSAEMVQRRWSDVEERETDVQSKRASVNIAIALPPDHLDPPPPYSRYAETSTGHEPRPRSQPPPAHATYLVKPYDPNDYVRPRSHDIDRSFVDVPVIAAPHPPTPVSPLNALDIQYLAIRHPPPPESNVTIESLLIHPMLRD